MKRYQSSLTDSDLAKKLDPNDSDSCRVMAYTRSWLDDFKGAFAGIKMAKQKGLKSVPSDDGNIEPINNAVQ